MKLQSIFIPLTFVAIAGCMTETETVSVTGPSAADPFIGKQLVAENGTVFEFRSDGSIGGSMGGTDPIVGTYSADSSLVCSTYSAPEKLTGREFCSAPQFTSANTVVFNRTDGSVSPPYTVR